MNAIAQIVEMDQERDRKTCLTLDLKVTGANRELGQWLLDHPRYSGEVVAAWLGCGKTRIYDLRAWAASGFAIDAHPSSARRRRQNFRRSGEPSLETNDNSESSDDFDAETGEVTDEIAAPDQIEDNILFAIQRINENARVFSKLLRASALDREAAERIDTAVGRMIDKWRSIQSTLAKKG